MKTAENSPTEQDGAAESVTRRRFISMAALSSAAFTPLAVTLDGDRAAEEIKKEKIRRAMLAGPSSVTAEATVAEMDHQGNLTVLRPGTNDWVCVPGDQNVVGQA